MAEVTYDDRSFSIDGRRIWLVSGAVHYFRSPAGLWPDRLLKARRAGLNCISTCIPWCLHEPQEGQWNLSGDLDIRAFIEQAADMGLYVILQPGPFVGMDLDFGGLPAWLVTKQGMAYRTNNAAFTHYYDKYFRQILPRLAEHQVTRGGSIVLIQAENDYIMTTMPDRLAYLEFIRQLFRRSGFEVPIISCNRATEPMAPGVIDTAGGSGNLVGELKKLRLRQPGAPSMAMALQTGKPQRWGGHVSPVDAATTARQAMEALGCGAQFNYDMWHGGTNFGFIAGRDAAGDASYQITSYDCDAPLAEGGGRTEKYYLTRLVNMLATHMGPFLAGCRMEDPGVGVLEDTMVLNTRGPSGRWAVVTNGGRRAVTSCRLSLPEGAELTVPLQPLGAAAIPVEVRLGPETVLNYCNLTPLGLFWEKLLVLHGPAGWSAQVRVNGQQLQASVPEGLEPTILEHQGLFVALISTELAMRTWLLEDQLLFGPEFVGATMEDIIDAPQARQYALLGPDGKLTHKKVKAAVTHKAAAPKLTAWKRTGVCVEPVSQELEWKPLDRPRDAAASGVGSGYVWYRAEFQADHPGRRALLLPQCEDRAAVYLNGELIGQWGRGGGATRVPLPGHVRRGSNVLTMLVDNLGRFSGGPRLGEPKGLFGHIYDAKPLPLRKPKLQPTESVARRLVPRHLAHLAAELETLPAVEAQWDLSLPKVYPIHLSFTGLPNHAAVICNGRLVEFCPCVGTSFADVLLGTELKKGKNNVKLVLWGEVDAKDLDRLRVHLLLENVTEKAAWSFRLLEVPKPGGPVVGKDQPAWYAANFKYAPTAEPLFVHAAGTQKGQLFLNGRNLGRYWTTGPQEFYYLPGSWLNPDNELLVFDERGDIPRNWRLEFLSQGPAGLPKH